jgi:hypothetical protein
LVRLCWVSYLWTLWHKSFYNSSLILLQIGHPILLEWPSRTFTKSCSSFWIPSSKGLLSLRNSFRLTPQQELELIKCLAEDLNSSNPWAVPLRAVQKAWVRIVAAEEEEHLKVTDPYRLSWLL